MLKNVSGRNGTVIPFVHLPRAGAAAPPHAIDGNMALPWERDHAGSRGTDWNLIVPQNPMWGAPVPGLERFETWPLDVEFTMSGPGPLRPMYLCIAWDPTARTVLAYGFSTTDEGARHAAQADLRRKRGGGSRCDRRAGLRLLDGGRHPESGCGASAHPSVTRTKKG